MAFQPEIESDVTVAYVQMPEGTPTAVTAAAVEQIADAAYAAARAEDERRGAAAGGSVFAHVSTSVGRQPYRIRQAGGPAAFIDGVTYTAVGSKGPRCCSCCGVGTVIEIRGWCRQLAGSRMAQCGEDYGARDPAPPPPPPAPPPNGSSN